MYRWSERDASLIRRKLNDLVLLLPGAFLARLNISTWLAICDIERSGLLQVVGQHLSEALIAAHSVRNQEV